jgi:hypothetical protein
MMRSYVFVVVGVYVLCVLRFCFSISPPQIIDHPDYLASKPERPAFNQAAGDLRCFTKHDWQVNKGFRMRAECPHGRWLHIRSVTAFQELSLGSNHEQSFKSEAAKPV